MGMEKWSTTAASNNMAVPEGWPEGMAPSNINDCARDNMASLKEWHLDAEWLKLGANGSANAFSISYVSATVFKFTSTDRRTLCPVNRRVKAGVGAGTIYGTVTDSSLSASDTQITVAWDSGSLDNSLSYVSLGILSPTNNSFPRNLDASFSDVTITGAVVGSVSTLAGEVASTSGTSIDFTGIPSWVKKITLQFVGVSTNGTDAWLVQLGDSGGFEAAGYLGGTIQMDVGGNTVSNHTTGFGIGVVNAAAIVHGTVTLSLEDAANFTWVASGLLHRSDAAVAHTTGGSKSTSAALTQVRITTTGGTNTFDAGAINAMYE